MTATDHATSRADELYRIHLRHLDDCSACTGGAECGRSARLRRAVRAARLAADRRPPPRT
ncbi:hypothetical protein [Streptomyces flavofungini]|uniref:hypothetical protein n=1 Tax=Streptomyces flavofungini TaxID=68200 RepID=UPI0025B023EC|nr:hypothetical protein [Streptomyces flavofungini]WJV47384.1 hypothetical protein QUY26_18770 [Streptomyces flavofungini]